MTGLRAVGLALASLLLAACSGAPSLVAPQPSDIEVDTPELQSLRAETGLEPCVPGAASTALPAVTLPCLGGGEDIDLSSLEGPMIISFWASNCTACRIEMPALQDFYEQHGDAVPVLGIDYLDLYPGVALEQVAKRGVTFPMLADPGGDLQETDQFVGVRGLPYLAFVDADGEVVGQHTGGVTSADELVGLVDEHLGLDL